MQAKLIPERLKISRENLGITRFEASKRINISQSAYVRYEKGQRSPNYATIIQIAQAMNTSPDYLTGENEDISSDTLVVSRTDNPVIFEIVQGSTELSEEMIERLYAYYKSLYSEQFSGK